MKIETGFKVDRFRLSASGIPEHMWGAVTRYIENAIPPGDFLTAVIDNNLSGAVARADDKNINALPAYVKFFYNYAPSECWGWPGKTNEWVSIHHTGGNNND